MSPATIRRTILNVLLAAKPYAVPAETLLAEVNRLVRPTLSPDALTIQLRALLDAVMIDFIADDLDPQSESAKKWFIKEAGEAALRK